MYQQRGGEQPGSLQKRKGKPASDALWKGLLIYPLFRPFSDNSPLDLKRQDHN
jgi:hypothetical protein